MLLAACQRGPKFFIAPPGADLSRGILHQVDKRDTLDSLAKYYQRDRSLLIFLNDLAAPYQVRPGDILYIPPENSDGVIRNGILTMEDIRLGRQGITDTTPRMAVVTSPEESKSGISRYISSRGSQPVPKQQPARPASLPDSTDMDMGPEPRADFPLMWPVNGTYARGFSKSGWQKFHMGVDLSVPEGTPIRAAQAGKVIFSGKSSEIPAYGILVVIDHGNGFATLYAHCSQTLVKAGDKVNQNDLIAKAGSTGNASGSHVHVELRYRGTAVNPERYFPSLSKESVLAGRAE